MALDQVKQDILKAALSEFASFGFEGTRIESITAKTHTSKRMIYYHFGSKERLYIEVLEYANRLVRENERPADLAHLAPLLALATYVGSAFDGFNKHPDFVRLNLQESLRGAPFLGQSASVAELNRASLAVIEEILARGQADGSMRSDVVPINVFINFIGLCSYNVASRHTYQAVHHYDPALEDNRRSRRESICDAIVRYVKA